MKKNELTYELICAAVNGEKIALNRILIYYDEYINALATIVNEDEQGEKHYYVDEDLRACSVSFFAHLFGKFCRLLRQKYLPYVSMSAYFFLVIDKIMLENPHIKRY